MSDAVPSDGTKGPRTFAALYAETLEHAIERVIEPHEVARDIITRGGAWINHARVRITTAGVLPGMFIAVHTPPAHAHSHILPDDAVIYVDRWLIALNKPAGTYVDATPWDAENHLRNALLNHWYARNGELLHLHPAHRLDRDTTGVLLFSRHSHANSALQRVFVQQRAKKTYVCHVAGWPDWDEILMQTGHGRSDRGRFRVYSIDEVGNALPGGNVVKSMETFYRVVERHPDGTTTMLAWPRTGRTHQIRLHANALGHPLVGDASYGSGQLGIDAHHLHAWRLSLPHPIHEEPLLLTAPLPDWCSVDLAALSASATILTE